MFLKRAKYIPIRYDIFIDVYLNSGVLVYLYTKFYTALTCNSRHLNTYTTDI